MKFFFVISLIILSAFSAKAEKFDLHFLNCVGVNGLEMNYDGHQPVISTKIGMFTKDFTAPLKAISQSFLGMKVTRIPLGPLFEGSHIEYDILLNDEPALGEMTRARGYVGKTYYGYVSLPTLPGPARAPLYFVPSTQIECQVLLK